jgi:hypothetical protein
MSLQIITAAERLAEKARTTIALVGPVGVGKTTSLRTILKNGTAPEKVVFVDCEAGDLPVRDLPILSVRPRRWQDCADVAALIGGPNPALPPTAFYSEAHFNDVAGRIDPTPFTGADVIFVDSITAVSRLSFTFAENSSDTLTERGKRDLRAVYGKHGQQMIAWLHQLQHARHRSVVVVGILERNIDDFGRVEWAIQMEGAKAGRELPGIVDQVITMTWVDFGDGKPPTRAFVCTNPNPWGYPAKDRSGRLEQIEPPDLGKLIEKLLTK